MKFSKNKKNQYLNYEQKNEIYNTSDIFVLAKSTSKTYFIHVIIPLINNKLCINKDYMIFKF